MDAATLTVSRFAGEHWRELGVWGTSEEVRAEPFDAVELSLDPWLLR